MTGHPRSVPRKPLDASLCFWPLYLVFLQKNFKQFKCYRSHMIYKVNEPSLRALMKTHNPGARREGRPWGHTALRLTAARRKPHGPSPMPCQTQPHVTSMWTTSEGVCRVTALSEHRSLVSLEGWGVLVGEGHATFRDRMFGEQRGCDNQQTLPGPPCLPRPRSRGQSCDCRPSAQTTGQGCTRSGAPGGAKLPGPLAQAHCIHSPLKTLMRVKGLLQTWLPRQYPPSLSEEKLKLSKNTGET